MWFIVMLLAVLMAGCNGNNASVGGGATPIVNSTVPVDGATNVALDATVSATFSTAMDSATLTETTFTLAAGATAVAGTVALSADGLTATFTPDVDLTEDTLYTATITTGAKSAAGNALAANKVWSFTTGPAPTVVSTTPATNQPVGTAISATFSEPITIAAATFTLAATETPDVPIPGTVALSADSLTVTFIPTNTLSAGISYTATLSGVRDLAGNPMVAGATWSFTPI